MLRAKLNLDSLEARECPAIISVSGTINERFANAFTMNHVRSAPDLAIVRTSEVQANVLAKAPPTMTQQIERHGSVQTNTVVKPATDYVTQGSANVTKPPTTLVLTGPYVG